MQALLITRKEVKVVETSGHYEDLKKLIGIESPITITERKIGDKYYDLWVDDEGLLKSDSHIQGCCLNAKELLMGNIIILSSNEQGESIGLSNSDIENIKKHIMVLGEKKSDKTLYITYHNYCFTLKEGDILLTYTI